MCLFSLPFLLLLHLFTVLFDLPTPRRCFVFRWYFALRHHANVLTTVLSDCVISITVRCKLLSPCFFAIPSPISHSSLLHFLHILLPLSFCADSIRLVFFNPNCWWNYSCYYFYLQNCVVSFRRDLQ
jgi:hypothetical protein